MKNWILRIKCFILGHRVVQGTKCPVTGIVRLDCLSCGDSNMPKHSGESRFK
jgi:uncharacterized protein (DUF2237 family)